MSVLAEIATAAGPSLAAHAVPEPGPERFGGGLGRAPLRLEAVYEGYLLHYGELAAFDGMEPDLRLLAGDALYALGLARLAESGDVPAVAELSDLISLSAQAHAEGRGGSAEALWDASASALEPGAR